jgi:hypothetical protein
VPTAGEPVPVPGRIVGATYVELGHSGLAITLMGEPVPAETGAAVPVPGTGEGIMVSVTTVMLVKLTVVEVVFKAAVSFTTGVGRMGLVRMSVGLMADPVVFPAHGRGRPVPAGALEFAADGTLVLSNSTGIVTLNSSVMGTAVGRMYVDVEFAGKGGIPADGVKSGRLVSGPVEKTGVRNVAFIAVDSDPTGRMENISLAETSEVDEASGFDVLVGISVDVLGGPGGITISEVVVASGVGLVISAGVGVTKTVVVVVDSSFESSLGPNNRATKSRKTSHADRLFRSSLMFSKKLPGSSFTADATACNASSGFAASCANGDRGSNTW